MGNYVPSVLSLRYDALMTALIHADFPDRKAADRDDPADPGRGRDSPAVSRGDPAMSPASPE